MTQTIEQLAAAQLQIKTLREALSNCLVDDPNKPFVTLATWRVKEALAIPRDTSALDAYVAEKVKEARRQMQHVMKAVWQRDLAVNALEAIAGRRIFIDNLASNMDIAVMTLDAIKESEEN